MRLKNRAIGAERADKRGGFDRNGSSILAQRDSKKINLGHICEG